MGKGVNSDLERDELATAPETLADATALEELRRRFLGLRATQPSPGTLTPARRNPMLRRTPNWPALEELDNATLDDAPALEELAQSATETLAPETLADAISGLADFLNE